MLSRRQDFVAGTEDISWLHESCKGIHRSGTVKCGLATHDQFLGVLSTRTFVMVTKLRTMRWAEAVACNRT